MRKKEVLVIFIALSLVFAALFSQAGDIIETKNVLLKFSLNKGDSIEKDINIYSDLGGEINLDIIGIKEGISFEEDNFILDSGMEKSVNVIFDTNSVNEGVYIGHIEISSGKEKEKIPVIFEIESKDVFFDANLDIPSRYSDISKGDKISVQLDIFDLFSGGGIQPGLGSSSVDIEYRVHDLDGNILISENDNLVIDKKAIITKTIDFPIDIETGQYVFSAVIKYKSSVGIVTDLFSVTEEENKESLFNLNGGTSNTIVILVFIGFVFLVLILFFVYIIRDRDKLFLELRKYNDEELKRHKLLLREEAKILKKRKKVSGKDIRKEINEKIKKIKEKHGEKIKQFEKLKKKGEFNEMKKKLREWKKKGYNTASLDYKLKDLSVGEMKEVMSKWKKKYNFK